MNRPTNSKTTDEQLENLYIKPTKDKGVNAPKYPDFADNYYHQADLLFMPEDDDYNYALVVIDVGSRMMDARPIKNKQADEVLRAFKDIYKGKILKPPTHVISVDSGHEFLGGVKSYFENDLKVTIKKGKPDRHTQQSIVERKNRDIALILFKRMVGEELQTGAVSKAWVKQLPNAIKKINQKTASKKRKRTYDKPTDPNAKILCSGDACDIIEQGTKVRAMLDAPVNAYDGKKLHGKFRETDIRFAIKPRTVMKSLVVPGKTPMYLLDDSSGNTDHSVAYTKNQLQIIPANEKKPDSRYIVGTKSKGVTRWTVDKLISRQTKNNRVYFSVKYVGFKAPEEVLRSDLMKDVPEMVKQFEKEEKEKAKTSTNNKRTVRARKV